MTPQELLTTLANHEKWLAQKAGGVRVNLTLVDLQGVTLSNANLQAGKFSGANLSRAILNGANLTEADLFAANLDRADLTNANVSRADLRGARDAFVSADCRLPQARVVGSRQPA